jgi:hypothetical protein
VVFEYILWGLAGRSGNGADAGRGTLYQRRVERKRFNRDENIADTVHRR